MMSNTISFNQVMTTANDGEGVLGKIVFYGLGGIMIDREEFERLRVACQFSAPTNFRSTPARRFTKCIAATTSSGAIPSAVNWYWKK